MCPLLPTTRYARTTYPFPFTVHPLPFTPHPLPFTPYPVSVRGSLLYIEQIKPRNDDLNPSEIMLDRRKIGRLGPDYFERLVRGGPTGDAWRDPRTAANWVSNNLFRRAKDHLGKKEEDGGGAEDALERCA